MKVFALTVKELLAVLRDRRSRFVIIGPPIIQILVFSYAASFDLNHVSVAIYDEDHSVWSRQLTTAVTGAPAFDTVVSIDHESQIADVIEDREILVVLRIASDFSESLLAGNTGRVQVIVDGRNSNTAMIALSYISEIVADLNRQWAADANLPVPAVLQVRARYNPNLDSRWFIVPGIIGLITLVVAMVVTSLSVAREREFGTFDQLLVTPLTPVEILLGKILPAFLIGTVEATFLLLIVVFWFEIPLRGSVLGLYLGLWLFLLSAVGVGLLISSISVTQQQALLGAFMFLVPAVILSGFATPIANMSVAVQYLSYINPLRYFVVVLREVFLTGATPDMLWPEYWPMALIGVLTLAFAAWLFRNRLY